MRTQSCPPRLSVNVDTKQRRFPGCFRVRDALGEEGRAGSWEKLPVHPLEGAWGLGRAHLAQEQDQRCQDQDCEEQQESDPGAEVGALTYSREVSGNQVGQIQHVAQRPADSRVCGLRRGVTWHQPPRVRTKNPLTPSIYPPSFGRALR